MGDQSEFAAIDSLTALEARLVDAVEKGQPFVPTTDEAAQPAQIRAELIRAILLGEKLSLRGRPWGRRAASPTRYGIRIHWPGTLLDAGSLLRIRGELNLCDIAPGDSGFLPPLDIRGCIFDSRLDLSGAHIQSLYLQDCRFSLLRAEGTRFAGSVRISSCGPRAPSETVDFGAEEFMGWPVGHAQGEGWHDGDVAFAAVPSPIQGVRESLETGPDSVEAVSPDACCEIMLRAAAIGAGLKIEKCSLRSQRLHPSVSTRSMRDVSALELSHAHVRDRVELTRSTFVGGARFVSTEIGDDVWIWGGKFLAPANRFALDFHFARIAGQLGVKGDNPEEEAEEKEDRRNAFFPVVVIGQFGAVGMSAGEVWIAGGFFHAHDDDEHGSTPTLNFAKADIKRTFKLGLYHPHYMAVDNRRGDRVYVHGELSLIATSIGKNLEVHGVRAGNVAEELQLGPEYDLFFGKGYRDQFLFKIGGEALKVDRRVAISHSKFYAGTDGASDPEAAPSSAATSAIDLFKATIGTGIKIKSDCECDGAVRLNSCVIGREAIVGCRIINAPPVHKGQDRGLIPWLLDMRESRIDGNLKIGRRSSESDAVTIAGGITLESAKVQGSTAIRKLTLDLTSFTVPEGKSELLNERERTALNLRDFVCGSEFEVHRLSWKLPPLGPHELEVLAKAAERAPWQPPWKARQYCDIENASYAVIDLRGFRCGLLSDRYGDEWGLTYRCRLRLGSLHIEELESGSDNETEARLNIESRLRWLNFQNRTQRVADPKTPARPVELKPSLRHEWMSLWERYHCSRGDDFVRHAYDVFARAYGRAGDERAVEEILLEKKNVQATLRLARVTSRGWDRRTFLSRVLLAVVIIGGLHLASWQFDLRIKDSSFYIMYAIALTVLAWPIGLAMLQLIARYGFRYGFSPDKALGVLALCILIGTAGVHYGRYGGLAAIEDWTPHSPAGTGHLDPDVAIVLEVPYAPAQSPSIAQIAKPGGSLLLLDPPGAGEPKSSAGTRRETHLAFAAPSPCNLDVSSYLYAADVFIPVLDLDQENRCSIRHDDLATGRDYTLWRVAKALYELLGWIVTSLVILVLTGVLRRDLERRISAETPGEA